MEDEEYPTSIWIKIKCYIFMKLGNSLWNYVIVHEDYWHRTYGISFTHRRDFPKLFKYDMVDMNDDIELELEKNR